MRGVYVFVGTLKYTLPILHCWCTIVIKNRVSYSIFMFPFIFCGRTTNNIPQKRGFIIILDKITFRMENVFFFHLCVCCTRWMGFSCLWGGSHCFFLLWGLCVSFTFTFVMFVVCVVYGFRYFYCWIMFVLWGNLYILW